MTYRTIDLGNGDALLCPSRPLTKQVLQPRSVASNHSPVSTMLAIVAFALSLGLFALAVGL